MQPNCSIVQWLLRLTWHKQGVCGADRGDRTSFFEGRPRFFPPVAGSAAALDGAAAAAAPAG